MSREYNLIPELYGLRGAACLIIVMVHAAQCNIVPFTLAINSWGGSFGVMIFFVLSGFLMSLRHDQERFYAAAWRTFAIKRFIRIYPVFYIALLIYAAVNALYIPKPLAELSFRYVHEIAVFKTTWWLFWTVPVELFFYAAFIGLSGFMALCLKRSALRIGFIFVVWALFTYYFRPVSTQSIATPWVYMSYFSAGMLIGLTYRYYAAALAKRQAVWEILLVLSLPAFLTPVFDVSNINPWPATHYYSALTAILVLSVAMARRPLARLLFGNRPLVFIGRISYSLYFMHGIVFQFYYTVPNKEAPSVHFMIPFALSLIAGYALYRTVELPSITLYKRILYRNRTS